MRFGLPLWFLPACWLLLASPPAPAADPEVGPDEQLLHSASLSADGPSLLEFFRQRTLNRAEPEKVAALIRQLGDKAPGLREKAAGDLVSLGPVAIPSLRQAAKDVDEAEAADRARRCLRFLEGNDAVALTATAARLLGARKPAGAAAALLAYLPFAEDDTVLDEIKNALISLAQHDGKPDPVLVRALEDPLPLRRAMAAEALCHVPGDELRATLRKLLQDPKPAVQMRVALALAGTARDPKAVSTMIAVLADVPPAQARQAEEYLLALAAEQAPKVSLGADDAARQKCRDAWAAWWLDTEKPTLLEELTRRTLTDALREKALKLIGQLGNDDFDVREKATTDLQALGGAVAPLLRQHAGDPDLEVSTRVQKCLAAVSGEMAKPLSPVIPRLVALRKPPGAAEALLGFVPFAEESLVGEETLAALAAVAVRDGKAEPVLVRALEDKLPLRRAAAAEALWRAGAAEQRQAVRKMMLQDPDPSVRLRLALAFVADQEKDAVPVLIALVGELPLEQGARAEEVLRRLAGERAPEPTLNGEEGSREKVRDAWAAWWREHGATVDLVQATPNGRFLGYTLVGYVDTGHLVELAPGGKVRWELRDVGMVYDAEALPGDRLLLAEFNNRRVTERNLKGEVIWQRQMNWPMNCQRLANGHTFACSRSELIELDKAGKDVLNVARPANDLFAARKLRDGQIVCVTNAGMCQRLDATGTRELKSFPIGQIAMGGLEVLPNNHLLVAHFNLNKVQEYDLEGKLLWEAAVATPSSAVRLANGHTLVTSSNAQTLVELDRTGKVFAEEKLPNRPWRVRRR
jgi:HEAT repeat protein